MNNKIIDVQEMLFRQMKRLDDDKLMSIESNMEIVRSNALSNQATTYIKAINTQMRIVESANKAGITKESLTKELGLDEKKLQS